MRYWLRSSLQPARATRGGRLRFSPRVEPLEHRLAPAGLVLAGADAGGGPNVTAFDADTGELRFSFFAFDPRFGGGTRVAAGDVTGDGTADLVAAAGPGGGPDVHVFDGTTGALVSSFFAFDPRFAGGVNLAVGDVNADGFADIVTGADAGGGPDVQVFSGRDGTRLTNFFADNPDFTGGVRVAAGDVNGDGFADVITAAGAGGSPQVKAIDVRAGALLVSFSHAPEPFAAGTYVAAGDLDGDGRAEIITGNGAGAAPLAKVFDARTGTEVREVLAFGADFGGGVRVGTRGRDGGAFDVVAAAGPGGGPDVQILDGRSLALLDSFFAFDPRFGGGVTTGGPSADLTGTDQPVAAQESLVNRNSVDRYEGDPDVAVRPDGSSVVVWRRMHEVEDDEPENLPGIKAQRYDVAGQPVGGTIEVDRDLSFDRPAVAADASGNFAVAWVRVGETVDDVLVRRFGPDGAPLGDAVVVASRADVQLSSPDVAVGGNGRFVVTWDDSRLDGDSSGIAARLYNPDGSAAGEAFEVNTLTADEQQEPAVAMDRLGNFVITWHSFPEPGPDGDADVFARRFDAAGTGLAPEVLVNTVTAGAQLHPAVGMAPAGGFVIAWYGAGADDPTGVYARRFDAGGTAAGDQFRVNTTTAGAQTSPAVAVGRDGGFVVTWQGAGPGDPFGIFARRYTSAGTALTGQLRLNANTENVQSSPAVASDRAGNFVVTWDSFNQENPVSETDVYLRRVSAAPRRVEQLAAADSAGLTGSDFDAAANLPDRDPTPAGGTTFVVLGDFGWSTSRTRGHDDHPVDYVAALVRHWHPDFVVSVGDTNYVWGKNSEFDENVGKNYAPYIQPYVAQESYGRKYPNSIPGTPPAAYNRWFGAPGNHDAHDVGALSPDSPGISRADYDRWYNQALQPAVSPGATPLAASYVNADPFSRNGSNGNPYYDYSFQPIDAQGHVLTGLANFIMIDGLQDRFGHAGAGPDGAQAEALLASARQFRSEHPDAWQFAFAHFEAFSSTHGGNIAGMNWDFQENGFDGFIAGHVHNYERLQNPANHFQYVVNGTGGFDPASHGSPFSPFDKPVGTQYPAAGGTITSVKQELGFGALLVTLTPTTATFQQWMGDPKEVASGHFTMVDSFTLTK